MNEDRLRRLLEDAAPTAPDGQVVLDTVRAGFQRARRRRQTRLAALGVVAIGALVIGGGIVFERGNGSSELDFRSAPDSGNEISDTGAADDGAAGGPDTANPDEIGTPDHLTNGQRTPESLSADEGSTESEDDSEADGSTPDGATSTTSTMPSTASTAPPPSSTPAASAELTEATEGGTVRAALVNGAISITEVTPAAGWSYEIEIESPDEVKVDFEQGEIRIRVRFDIENGELVSSTERESDGEPDHDSSEGS